MMDYFSELPMAITVCDTNGIIVYMNEKSKKTFEKDGGEKLIGTSLFDCHPAHANLQIKKMLSSQEKNVYTIEKNGIKKMIYQTPWFEQGKFKGFVELSLEIPIDIKHFIRK